MNPVIRTRWADALRSGDYEQTKGSLNDGKGYCCLGVLCDLYAQDHGTGWEPCNKHAGNNRVEGTLTSAWLPREVADWAMLSEEEVSQEGSEGYDVQFPLPKLPKGSGLPSHSFIASALNDNYMEDCHTDVDGSFADIADLVELMPSTYKESQRGRMARVDVEDEEYVGKYTS